MTTLVIGGTGFIGGYVLGMLRQSGKCDRVISWRRDVDGDFLQRASRLTALKRYRPTRVLQIGWCSTASPDYESGGLHEQWAQATIASVGEVLESGAWYGLLGTIADGAGAEAPVSPYRVAKVGLRQAVEPLSKQHRLAILRPSYVYSEIDLRPRLMRAIGRPSFDATEIRTPLQKHDFIQVVDVARGIVLTTDLLLRGIVNLTTGWRVSVGDFVDAVGGRLRHTGTLGSLEPSLEADRPIMLTRLGWSPEVSARQLRLPTGRDRH